METIRQTEDDLSGEAKQTAPSASGSVSTPAPEKQVVKVQPAPGSGAGSASDLGATSADEKTWAMLAHLTMLLNLFTAFLGLVVAFVIYLAYKDKSSYVADQAMQAFLFQLIAWVILGGMVAGLWVVVGLLSIIVVGICLIPLAIIFSFIPLASVVYAVFGGIRCSQGEDFRYWLIGDWVKGIVK